MKTFRKILFWSHLICGDLRRADRFHDVRHGRRADLRETDPAMGRRIRCQCGMRRVQPDKVRKRCCDQLTRMTEGSRPRFSSDPIPDKPVHISFGRQAVEVNPCTGEAMGEGAVGLRKFFRQMIVWHRWLGQEGEGRAVGKAITGACNLAFLFIIVSAAIFGGPSAGTGRASARSVFFRSGLPGKARDFNWHNVFGLWCAIPLFLIAGTAVFFSYSWGSDILYALTGEERPAPRGRASEGASAKGDPTPPSFEGLDALWHKATALEPDWRIVTMRLEQRSNISFILDRGSGFRPDLRSTLVLDRRDRCRRAALEVLGQFKAQNARSWIRWLHTGEAGGLVGQTLAGVASLAACLLVYTGWMLSWRRFQSWRARQPREAVQRPRRP